MISLTCCSVAPTNYEPLLLTHTLSHHSLLSSSQEPVLSLTQSEITSYTLNFRISNESSYTSEVVVALQTWVKVPGVQLGRSYNAFVTASNAGGQSNSSEVLTLSK